MNPQHIIVLDINAQTEQFLKDRLAEGYYITIVTNLAPLYNKLLIVYVTPSNF
jgi:hypothetical protein